MSEEMEKFVEQMKTTTLMALASSVGNESNVRIIDFLYDEETKKVYFPTHAMSQKTKEFAQNDTVSFTTIPFGPLPTIRVKGAKIAKSDKPVDEIKDALIAKRAGIEFMLKGFGENAVVYEISFAKAVMVDKGKPSIIEL